MEEQICPCRLALHNTERLLYTVCCKPLHREERNFDVSAETLMRSRFSAYVLQLENYLLNTWHASTRPENIAFDSNMYYLTLHILHTEGNLVHFQAIGQENGNYFCLEEKSNFVWEQNKCYYLNGNAKFSQFKPPRNELCPCGSGKKHKKCCL